MQSKPEEITVEEVKTRETLDENAQVEECITQHTTHISRASTTEAFGTTEASSAEEYTEKDTTLEPTSAEPDTTIETYLHVNLHALWIHLHHFPELSFLLQALVVSSWVVSLQVVSSWALCHLSHLSHAFIFATVHLTVIFC